MRYRACKGYYLSYDGEYRGKKDNPIYRNRIDMPGKTQLGEDGREECRAREKDLLWNRVHGS